jgi:hypothetical protein
MEKRRVNGWQDFDGIEFVGKIGVEKDKTGKYSDRNRLQSVITPDSRDYQPVQQQGGFLDAWQNPADPALMETACDNAQKIIEDAIAAE